MTNFSQPGFSMLRIETVRHGRDGATYECVAENGVGDPVYAKATLTVYDGKCDYLIAVQIFFALDVCNTQIG